MELVETEDTISLNINEKYHTKEYAVLEMMGHQPHDSISFMQVIFWLLRNPNSIPPIIEQIGASVSVKGKLFYYEYNSALAEALCHFFQQPPLLIPDDWKFSWGGRKETTLLLNALSIRCAYHFVAVYAAAISRGLVGDGCNDLVLIISIDQLCNDLQALSSLPIPKIRNFVDTLIYGTGVKSPDPALQPLVLLGKNQLALSPLHILSSHMERNLLVLQARTQPSQFDSMSSAFERDMVKAIMEKISPHWEYAKPNYTWTFGAEFEEFDLIMADPESHQIFLCEMRWMLQPGEPREVAQRKEYCFQKVQQLRRKIEWLRPNILTALDDIFGITSDKEGDWKIFGIVVIDGFGGVMSPDEDIPIIPIRVFERAMVKLRSLEHLSVWASSLVWLPQEGIYFKMEDVQISLTGKVINYQGMDIIQDRKEYLSYLDKTLELNS